MMSMDYFLYIKYFQDYEIACILNNALIICMGIVLIFNVVILALTMAHPVNDIEHPQ